MVKIIAHRGNTNGPNPSTENTLASIRSAIELGFDCEIDVWYIRDEYYLGHDFPQTHVSVSFLTEFADRLWIHCKHLDALVQLKDTFNCFYHEKDIYTITSRGYIWGNINSPTHISVIQVMPEKGGTFSADCAGICTDFPNRYAALLQSK